MYEFIYHVKFRKINDDLDVKIFLSLDDLFTPVYIRTYDQTVLNHKEDFLMIYREIEEYLTKKKVVMNRDDLRLFYDTLSSFDIALPNIEKVLNESYDEGLDQYGHMITPKEIIFLINAEGKSLLDKRFKAWEDDNNLSTPYLKEQMLYKGFLTKDNYSFNLLKAKRDLLLEVVANYKLDIRGDNNDLIKGIQRELSEDVIKKHFSGTHFSLTEKGKKIIERSSKLEDFYRSFYRFVNKLPLEEFHLLSLKKSDYDFSGIGRLLMVNSNNEGKESFDWDSLQKKNNDKISLNSEVENTYEIKDKEIVNDDEFTDLVNQVNLSFHDKMNEPKVDVYHQHRINEEVIEQEKQEVKKEITYYDYLSSTQEDDDEEILIDEIYIDEDPNIKAKLEAYHKKRELYEQQKQKRKQNSKKKIKLNQHKQKNRLLKWIFTIIGIIFFLIGLIYVNDLLNLVPLPINLEDLYSSFQDTLDLYKKMFFG